MPGSTVRTAISFLLFVHLFFVFSAVLSSNSGVASQLEQGLRNVPGFRPYAEALALDWPFASPLTFGNTEGTNTDSEHWIEVELIGPNGEKQTVVLPPKELRSTQRLRRYETLVRTATIRWNGMEDNTILQAVASSLVDHHGATRGTIRIRRKGLPPQPFLTQDRPDETVYEARILVSGGKVQLFKTESASDSAPAAARGATPKKNP